MAFDLDCHNHMVLNLLPPILKELLAEFPLLRPTLHLVPFPSLLSMVENGRLHAALGTKDEQKKTFLPFKEFFTAPSPVSVLPIIPLPDIKPLPKDSSPVILSPVLPGTCRILSSQCRAAFWQIFRRNSASLQKALKAP